MGSSVAVLIPWKGGCPAREAALSWVLSQYEAQFPEWEVVLGNPGDGPWSKGRAIEDAFRRSSASTIVCADADCWTGGLAEAVAAIERGAAWSIAHRRVLRLSEESTVHFMTTGEVRHPFDRRPYTGMAGGGFVVARREVIASIPPDPRFTGWG